MPAKGAMKIDGKLDEWDLSGQIWSYADTSVPDTFSVKTAARDVRVALRPDLLDKARYYRVGEVLISP